jgi:hypothetical protein
MRVIIVARQSLTPSHEAILTRLVNILGEISKNPSNPKFNQYCFESVSALIRFVCDGTPGALPRFEQAIFGPAQIILANDVAGELFRSLTPSTELNIRIHPIHLPDPSSTPRATCCQRFTPRVSSSASTSTFRDIMGTKGKYPSFDEDLESPSSTRWTYNRSWWTSTRITGYFPATCWFQDG